MTWPKRMRLQAFIQEGFLEGSRPDAHTMKQRIKKGEVPGEKLGGTYYVFVGPNLELMSPQTHGADALADSLMHEWLDEAS